MTLHAHYEGIDLQTVEERYHAEKRVRIKERYLAVKLSYQGYQAVASADILSRHRVTVQAWLNAFNELGWEGLEFDDIPGGPAKLTAAQKETVKKILAEKQGQPKYFTGWTVKQAK